MSDKTIVSGSSFDLSIPLTTGTNIDFVNNPTISGTLTIEPTAITPTGIGGGTIENFEPGDTLKILNLESITSELGYPSDVQYPALLVGSDLVIAVDGSVTSTDFLYGFLNSKTKAQITTLANTIEHELFGTIALAAPVTLNIVADTLFTDAVVASTVAINACFAAGTRIATTRGEIAVEDLEIGDQAVLAEGGTAPIRWIGHRDLDLTRHPTPSTVRPVRIAPGALGHGVPATELTVSPDHALFLDGVLVQAKDLIDGLLIRQDKTIVEIRYYHVELPEHRVLLANGAPAESYLDTGHRGVFANSGAPLILHPDLMQIRREAESLAPLVTGGPELAAIRARLHAHKLMLGYTVNDTPVLCLKINNALHAPTAIEGGRFTFALAENTLQAILACPVFVPAEIDPASNDRRVLGLAVAELWLDGKPTALHSVINATDLHPCSPGDPHIWTKGAARLSLPAGTKTLTISIAGTPRLWRRAA